MRITLGLALVLILCGTSADGTGSANDLISAHGGGTIRAAAPARDTTLPFAFGGRPLVFEKNEGQLARDVRFVARGQNYALFLTNQAATWVWQERSTAGVAPTSQVVTMRLVGGSADPVVSGIGKTPLRTHHFAGNVPGAWRTDVSTFDRVRYEAAFAGIGLEYYGRDGQLEYDFVVEPGADPSSISVEFDGVDQLRLLDSGDLVMDAGQRRLRQQRPIAYQVINGQRRPIGATFVRQGARRVGFEIDSYDRTQPLVIDPVLSYSTYVGGTGGAYGDHAYGVTTDPDGNVYVVGWTNSIVFPEAGGQATVGGGNAFVMKFTPSGALVYTTIVGGSGIDSGEGLAVDGAGQVVFTGWTDSTDLPTANPIRLNQGGRDAFLTKLDAAGRLVFSTYVGGNGSFEYGESVAIDADGAIYLTGSTYSTNFPVVNAFQPTRAGNVDAYVIKVTADGSLLYGSYLGGTALDNAESIALDGQGNFIITGNTASADFPTVSPFQTNLGGDDVYVAKFAPDGSYLVFSTYLGGGSADKSKAILVDDDNRIYVSGSTDSTNFPVVNGLHANRGSTDAYITRLTEFGAVDFSTYLGGNGADTAFGLALADRHLFVTGQTASVDFPIVNGLQPAKAGAPGIVDAFVSDIDVDLLTLAYSSYLGGTGADQGRGVAAVAGRNVFIAGWTESDDFPTELPIQDHKTATGNVFLSRLAPYGVTSVSPGAGSIDGGDVVTITGQGFVTGSSVFFGGSAASGVDVSDTTSLTAVTPAHASGFVDVTVVGPDGGSGTLYRGFAFRSGGAPVADAGPDQQVEATSAAGGMVTLDGSGSFDPDGGSLTFIWSEDGTILGSGQLLPVTLGLGAHSITLTVSNGTPTPGVDTMNAVVVDTAPPAVTVLSPNGANVLYATSPTILEWTASDGASAMGSFTVYLSTDGGVSYGSSPICSVVPAIERQCTWTPSPATTKGRIKVIASDVWGNTASDVSDANFTIATSGTPTVKVTAPNTAVNWGAGSTQRITWTHNLGAGAEMNLDASLDGGSTWFSIASRIRNASATAGNYNWTLLTALSSSARVRVTWNNGNAADVSDVNFTIAPAFITPTAPVGANWGYGTRQTQTWTTNLGSGDQVEIALSADDGVTFSTILAASVAAGAGTATVVVPTLPAATAAARTRVRWLNAPDGYAAPDGLSATPFQIEPAFVRITSPNGGNLWTAGTTASIAWSHNLGSLEMVTIALSLDDGVTFPVTAVATTPSDGSQVIAVDPAWTTAQARVRVSWTTDGSTTDVSDAAFAINAAAVVVTSPNGGEQWTANSTGTITWVSNLGPAENVRIELSLDGGSTYPLTVLASTPSDGTQTITVNPAWATSQARFRIAWVKQAAVADVSDADFSIDAGFVTLTSPNGGEDWAAGGTRPITWIDNLSSGEKVKIELSLDGGSTYPIVLLASTPADGVQSVTWNAAWATPQARVRISWVKQPAIADVSDATFLIRTAQVVVTSPNGGEVWTVGSQRAITWTGNLGSSDNVKIQLSLNGGGTYPITVTSSTPSDGTQTFTIPSGWRSQNARIRVTWVKNGGVTDVSDANFVIQ
jgi:hypothetical protein